MASCEWAMATRSRLHRRRALTHDEYTRHLTDAGLTDIDITETHRVHTHAGSAIIRARKPAS